MNATELLQNVQFVTDADGNKTAVLLDCATWEEVMTILEDIEDAEEIRRSRRVGRRGYSLGAGKAELRAKGIIV